MQEERILVNDNAENSIETKAGIELYKKAVDLAELLNSINSILRDNGVFNITDLRDFGDLVDYTYTTSYAQRKNATLEVNKLGIFNKAKEIEALKKK